MSKSYLLSYKKCGLDLCSSGILDSVHWYFVTDVLGQPIGSHLQGQIGCPEKLATLGDGIDRLSRNVCNKDQCMLHKIPKEQISHLHCGGSLKSR